MELGQTLKLRGLFSKWPDIQPELTLHLFFRSKMGRVVLAEPHLESRVEEVEHLLYELWGPPTNYSHPRRCFERKHLPLCVPSTEQYCFSTLEPLFPYA